MSSEYRTARTTSHVESEGLNDPARLLAAYRVGRTLNHLQWLAQLAVIDGRPLKFRNEIEGKTDELVPLIDDLMAAIKINPIQSLIASGKKEWNDLLGSESFTNTISNCHDEFHSGNDRAFDLALNWAEHPWKQLRASVFDAIESSAGLVLAVLLGETVDQGIHTSDCIEELLKRNVREDRSADSESEKECRDGHSGESAAERAPETRDSECQKETHGQSDESADKRRRIPRPERLLGGRREQADRPSRFVRASSIEELPVATNWGQRVRGLTSRLEIPLGGALPEEPETDAAKDSDRCEAVDNAVSAFLSNGEVPKKLQQDSEATVANVAEIENELHRKIITERRADVASGKLRTQEVIAAICNCERTTVSKICKKYDHLLNEKSV